MTVKTLKKSSSVAGLVAIRDSISEQEIEASKTLPISVLETWETLPESVRTMLVNSELTRSESAPSIARTSSSSMMSTPESTSGSSNSDENGLEEIHETDPTTGTTMTMRPLERAPKNVFAFTKSIERSATKVEKTPAATVTTTTKVVTGARGWRNVFTLPIAYDVNMVPHGTILDPSNLQMLQATGIHPEGYNRRFAVIDDEVDKIYGKQIRQYFVEHNIELTTCILSGGEAEKRTDAVDKLLDDLCAYKLRRREPFLAIGGGVLLDIAGMGACLYRRGVPFVRVPTTLLAIVDASVGVKNGVDYCCDNTNETYKNRVGSFYAPSA